MAYYDLNSEERKKVSAKIHQEILAEVTVNKTKHTINYFSDEDTYIRKNAYLAIGKIYKQKSEYRNVILQTLESLFHSDNSKVRQTVINAAGEIGMSDFTPIQHLMETGLFDSHHSVRNAVIGSIKKMGEKNPKPVLLFAKKYLHHEDKEIRREICHGIELRGRKHPEDILPLLKELQFDKTARVRNTLIHVLGQIAYKDKCIEKVVTELKTWENKTLVLEALDEIIDVHERYKNFAVKTQKEAMNFIESNFK